ncbi:unnamed protein product [Closterium sp. Yama58-4]|nr:unnamed protein product [Closterium sp. Yama58-4]
MTVPLPSTPPPPRDFLTEYSLGRHLGKGAFGEVLECTHKATGRQFACKRIDKRLITSESDAAEVRKEVAILQQLTAAGPSRHGGIVQLVEALEDGAAVYLVMELCEGGDLFELIKSDHAAGMPEDMAREIFRQVALAVAYCHARGVLHRDIKPENILFTGPNQSAPAADFGAEFGAESVAAECSQKDFGDSSAAAWRWRVRVADFGLALFLPHGQMGHGMAGSRFYTAPEMVRGRKYGKRADVWSMGVVLCAMLTGRVPFAGKDRADAEGLRRSILRGAINFSAPAWAPVSAGARDLVRRMLEVDPRRRLKAAEVLQHPWVLGLELPELTAADAAADVVMVADAAGSAETVVSVKAQSDLKPALAVSAPGSADPRVAAEESREKKLGVKNQQKAEVKNQALPIRAVSPPVAPPATSPPIPPTAPRVASPLRSAAFPVRPASPARPVGSPIPIRPIAQPPLGSAIERFNKYFVPFRMPSRSSSRSNRPRSVRPGVVPSTVVSRSYRPSRRRPVALLPSSPLPLSSNHPRVFPGALSLSPLPFLNQSPSPLPSRCSLSRRSHPVAIAFSHPYPSLYLSPHPFPSLLLSPLPSRRSLSRRSLSRRALSRLSLPVALGLSHPFPSLSLSPLPSRRSCSLPSLPVALSLAAPFPSRSLSPCSLRVALSHAAPFPSPIARHRFFSHPPSPTPSPSRSPRNAFPSRTHFVLPSPASSPSRSHSNALPAPFLSPFPSHTSSPSCSPRNAFPSPFVPSPQALISETLSSRPSYPPGSSPTSSPSLLLCNALSAPFLPPLTICLPSPHPVVLPLSPPIPSFHLSPLPSRCSSSVPSHPVVFPLSPPLPSPPLSPVPFSSSSLSTNQPYTPEQVFDVVAGVEHYADFLPWCVGSHVLWRAPEGMEAELEIGFHMLREKYLSRVTYKRPLFVTARSTDTGLFHHLDNHWEFAPGRLPGSCLLSFSVDFQFCSLLYTQFLDLFFDEVVSSLVNSFERRCEEIYGPSKVVMTI